MPTVSTDIESIKITKANKLAEVKLLEVGNRLKLRDQKIILAVIGQISPDDEDFKDYRVTIAELVSLTGISSENLYRDINVICTRLMSSVITIKESKNPGGFLMVTWFSHAEFNPSNGYIEFSISPKLKPYLLQLKNQFTTYNLKQVVNLKSTYSIRLYELLRQFLPLKGVENGKRSSFREITISDLREYLGVEKKRYPKFYDFKRYVLEKSQEELKDSTDIAFDFEPIRAGRKISSIKFIIRHNHRFESLSNDVIEGVLDKTEMRDEINKNPMVDFIRMHFEGITDEELFLIINTYSDAVIKESLMAWMKARFDGKIETDLKSYFFGILANKRREDVEKSPKTTKERLTDRSWADDSFI